MAVTGCADSSICGTEYRRWAEFYPNAAYGGAPAAKGDLINHSCVKQLSPWLNTAGEEVLILKKAN